jgi:excisionase family DNA binding protein
MTDLPKLMTVPQAARALRIGRSTAYDMANAWLASNGAEGLPVVRIGRSLRVPVAALDRWFTSVAFGETEPAARPAEPAPPTSPEGTVSGQISLFPERPAGAGKAQPSRSRPRSSAAARSRSCRKAE